MYQPGVHVSHSGSGGELFIRRARMPATEDLALEKAALQMVSGHMLVIKGVCFLVISLLPRVSGCKGTVDCAV